MYFLKLLLFLTQVLLQTACATQAQRLRGSYSTAALALAKPKERSTDVPESCRYIDEPALETREVYFVRHGESEWNVLQKSEVHKKLASVFRDIQTNLKGDSSILDAPLSSRGVSQCKALRQVMESLLKEKDAAYVVSNLRRAIQTAIFGFAVDQRVFHVHSALQESTDKPDGVSFWVPDNTETSIVSAEAENIEVYLDLTHNYGNKSLAKVNERLKTFAEYVFDVDKRTLVVVGHSNFFRRFFERYSSGLSRTKMKNTEVVRFEFAKQKDSSLCIVPGSVEVVYPGA
jgi:broad specificity phosphatase PhoE